MIMTRLLLTLLIAFVPLFSSPVLAEQNIASLHFTSEKQVTDTVFRWLVDSSHPICSGYKKFESAAMLHRQELLRILEVKLASTYFSEKRKKQFSATYFDDVARTYSNDYFVLCSTFSANEQLDLLLESELK